MKEGHVRLAPVKHRQAIFTTFCPGDLPAELVCQRLHTITDAKDRKAALINIAGSKRGTGDIDAGRSAGKDKTLRLQCCHYSPWGIMGDDLRVDAALPHAPGDQPAIL
ncbi:MAG: hypothetical protein DDT28_00981 [Dehalococcoidia bacterium]|nr:hypothetical protein [Chloroflexota bacterium]